MPNRSTQWHATSHVARYSSFLKNCEHEIGTAVTFCESILRAAPHVKVLNQLPGSGLFREQVSEMPPLALPSDACLAHRTTSGTADSAQRLIEFRHRRVLPFIQCRERLGKVADQVVLILQSDRQP